MKNTKFAEKIDIISNIEFVFDYTQDYRRRLTWDTFLKKAELTGGAKPDVGVKAYCVAKMGWVWKLNMFHLTGPRQLQ